MPSLSLVRFQRLQDKAILLRQKAAFSNRKEEAHTKSILLHSALAFNVSSWDAYINSIVKEFYIKVQDTTNYKYTILHGLALSNAETSLKRFNTPNHENAREIILRWTGYDPYRDWVWERKGWNSLQTRDFLNQILQVRHSFAHGYSMPHFDWNTDSAGNSQLLCRTLQDIESFFKNLVKKTDRGLKRYILDNFNIDPWK